MLELSPARINSKPSFERYGFIFSKAGKNGTETAWKAEIDSGKNKTINRKVKDSFGVLIDPPHGEKELSSKNLRAAYAAIAIYLFCPWNYSTNLFITERLGHVSDATASNYEDYRVTDKQGRPQTRGAWVERLEEEVTTPMEQEMMSRLRLTKKAKETIDDKDFLPYEDQLSRINELALLDVQWIS